MIFLCLFKIPNDAFLFDDYQKYDKFDKIALLFIIILYYEIDVICNNIIFYSMYFQVFDDCLITQMLAKLRTKGRISDYKTSNRLEKYC